MPYKDLDKRRTATRERVRRYRDRQKALQDEPKDVTPSVTLALGQFSVLEDVVEAAIDRLDRRPLTKERQVSKQGFND